VQHLLDYDSTDQVFSTLVDEENNVSIIFGDGVSGAIPTLYSEIRTRYTVGGGSFGNIVDGILDTIDYIPGLSESQVTALQSTLTVANNSVAVGGSDPEDTNQIRTAAPISLRANTRAVTLQDFADLSLAVTGVGKANATASVWTSVTVYIAPTRSATDADPAPGLDENGDPTLEYDGLKEDVEVYLSDKILLGTTVTVSPPTYVDVLASIQYTKLDQYTNAEIELAIKNKILSDFGYAGVFFEDTIYPQDIEFALQQVPGIKVAKVTQLYRDGASPALTTLIGDPDELFRFTEANTNITEI
jgi:predicted phage baseplate assembly protein